MFAQKKGTNERTHSHHKANTDSKGPGATPRTVRADSKLGFGGGRQTFLGLAQGVGVICYLELIALKSACFTSKELSGCILAIRAVLQAAVNL